MHQWKFSINNQKPLVMEHDYYEISNKFLDKDWYLWIWILWLPSNYNLTMLTLVAWHGVAVTPHSAWASHVSPLSGIHFRLLSPAPSQLSSSGQNRKKQRHRKLCEHSHSIVFSQSSLSWQIVRCWAVETELIQAWDNWQSHIELESWPLAVISNDQAPSPGPPMVTCVVTGR